MTARVTDPVLGGLVMTLRRRLVGGRGQLVSHGAAFVRVRRATVGDVRGVASALDILRAVPVAGLQPVEPVTQLLGARGRLTTP